MQNSEAVQKVRSSTVGVKKCEIKGGSQEMTAKIKKLILINFILAVCITFTQIDWHNSAISWLLQYLLQFFSPRCLKAIPFLRLECFCMYSKLHKL